MSKQTNNPDCYSIAKRQPASNFWINSPIAILTLQRSLVLQPGDVKRFVVGFLFDDEIERFATPLTLHDGVFWANGLDRVTFFSESFLLFDSSQEAFTFACRQTLKEAVIYRLSENSKEKILYLEPEQIVRPKKSISN